MELDLLLEIAYLVSYFTAVKVGIPFRLILDEVFGALPISYVGAFVRSASYGRRVAPCPELTA